MAVLVEIADRLYAVNAQEVSNVSHRQIMRQTTYSCGQQEISTVDPTANLRGRRWHATNM